VAFVDGVCFVDLAPLSDHLLVAKAIAEALGVPEHPKEPVLDTLKRALAQRELLLLMDNYEHVIKAAPVVSALLAAASRLKGWSPVGSPCVWQESRSIPFHRSQYRPTRQSPFSASWHLKPDCSLCGAHKWPYPASKRLR